MAHIHELIDYCVETFVVYQNKVLLRKHDKYDIWLSVGGHIELAEEPNIAAIREVKEEVGLDITLYFDESKLVPDTDNSRSLIPPEYLSIQQISETHQHVTFIYFATSESNELTLCDVEVTEECHWFSKEELEKNEAGVGEDVRQYALKALTLLSND